MIFLRSLLFNALYVTLSLALSVYGALFTRTEAQALGLGQLWARLMVAAARRLCGIRLAIAGGEHLPADGAALIASQHQSAYDTMIWLALLPNAAYVMKSELARIPLFGKLTVLAGMIPVERQGGATALRALMTAASKAARAGRQMIIFPQGTRAAPGAATILHPGIAAIAARTALPVIPVRTDSGRCWARRAFLKRPGTIHMTILPPLPAGLPRAMLMGRLMAAFSPVDTPVGPRPGELAPDGNASA